MDSKNRFHTDDTWFLVRAEHVALLGSLIVLLGLHVSELNWPRFIAALVVIDLVGYVPGAIAYRRAHGGPIAPLYHHLYNFTHSYLTGGLVVGLWALAGGWEWAMLAVPIQLSGDRGLFGNTYKPVSLPFEPADIVAPTPAIPPLKESP